MRSVIAAVAVTLFSACSLIIDTDPYLGDLKPLIADAGPDQTVLPTTVVSLDASASSNPNGGGAALSFEWRQTGGPEVELMADGSPSASFTAPAAAAVLTFTVTVTAGQAPTASDDVVITINSAPISDAGDDREVMSARRVFLDAGRSYDPDDEPLTFEWSQTSGPTIGLTGASTSLAYFVSPAMPTSYGFRVTVCDAAGECASDDVAITVHRYVHVAAGWFHGAALRSDGTVWTWGEDQWGVLGIGETGGYYHQPYPNKVIGLPPVVRLHGDSRANYAITESGETYSWGINCNGESGYPAIPCERVEQPRLMDEALHDFVEVARGDEAALYLSADGVLTGIGYNKAGVLGSCPPPNYLQATELPGTFKRVAMSRFYDNFALAIGGGGHLIAWGYNNAGQLGNNTTSTGCTVATQITANSDWTAVAAGRDHSAAIRAGRLYTWGANSNGAGVNQLVPVFRGSLTNWSTVVAADQHAYALRSDGSLYAWGRNDSGQLGLGDQTSRYLSGSLNDPPRVGTDSDWGGIAAGYYSGFALKNDGSIWAMGGIGDWAGQGMIAYDNLLVPTRIADGPARCGDDTTQNGYLTTMPRVAEACDSGSLNGNEGHCSASCRCPSTRVVYVDARATGGGDGTSWADAYPTLQAALDAEGECDTIWVAQGSYTNGGGTAPVAVMNVGSEIYGGFAGYETRFTERNPSRYRTVLDGLGQAHHVVVASGDGVLDGVVIRGGNANGTAPADAGGGLYVGGNAYDEKFQVRDVVFEANVAATHGGAMYVSSLGTIVIERSMFRGNVSRNGGALALVNGELHVLETHFRGNQAVSLTPTGGQGGAIWLDGSIGVPRINNVLFVANSASNQGAALWLSRQSALAHVTTFANVGGSEVIRNGHASTSCTNCAAWNPEVPSTSNTGWITYSCFPGATETNGNVALSASPFEVVGAGSDAQPYLAASSPCRDAAYAPAAYLWVPDWHRRTTTADGAFDATPPDMGYHWPAP
jgi:predicted outer membrane repeat protein